MMKVGEDSIARPNRSNVNATIRILEPDIRFGAPGIWLISSPEVVSFNRLVGRLTRCNLRVRCIVGVRDIDPGVKNWNVVTTRLMQSFQEPLPFFIREAFWIILPISIPLHVVNVSPVG
jgi:hypothetical protein